MALVIKVFGVWGFNNIIDSQFWWLFMSISFMVVGASIYGQNPHLLKNQLTVYFSICVPIMLIQIMGLSWIFMTWNTEYAHDFSILSLEEIGTFKKVPVYPTLFVKSSDLISSIGQIRPSGLSYSNNVLSVIIGIYTGLVLSIKRKNNYLRYEDMILALAIVFSGSLTSLAIALILILLLTIYAEKSKRIFLRKFTLLLLTSYGIYSFLFPGIFYSVFSYASIWDSLLWRIMDLSSVVGYFDYFSALFSEQMSIIEWKFNISSPDDSFSGIAIILKSRFIILICIFTLFFGFLFWKKFKKYQHLNKKNNAVYVITLLACLLTQFGIPYFNAPIFQIFLGFSLYPVFSSYKGFHRINNAPQSLF